MTGVNKVKIENGTRKKITETFDISVTSVSFALSGKTNSDLTKKIRKAAVEMGGDPIYDNNDENDDYYYCYEKCENYEKNYSHVSNFFLKHFTVTLTKVRLLVYAIYYNVYRQRRIPKFSTTLLNLPI